MPNVSRHAIFRQNHPNGCANIAIFSIINMAAVRHLGFTLTTTEWLLQMDYEDVHLYKVCIRRCIVSAGAVIKR